MKLIISLAFSQIMGILAVLTAIANNDPTFRILIALLFLNLIVSASVAIYSYLKQS